MKKKLNIGVIVDSVRENATGIGRFSQNICENLVAIDQKNTYFFIDYETNTFNQRRLMHVVNPFPIFKTYLWYNLLPIKINNTPLDIILNLGSGPHLLPFRQKEYFFLYDLSWRVYPKTHDFSRVALYKALMPATLDHSFKIIASSLSTREDILKYYQPPKSKVTVIYGALPKMAKRTKRMATESPYALYVGTLEPRKNIPAVIRAVHFLQMNGRKNLKLIICGQKGWGYDEIFQETKKLGMEESTIFTGYVTQEEKTYLYQHADVFVYPSFYEGFGLPILEAMSCGCPVITANNSSLTEVLGDAGIAVNPYNDRELAKAIDLVLGNEKLRSDLRSRGLRRVHEFSWKRAAEELIALYR